MSDALDATQDPTSDRRLGGAITNPAWKLGPAGYGAADEDRASLPALQRSMAMRAAAQTTSGAATVLSHPAQIAAVLPEPAAAGADQRGMS